MKPYLVYDYLMRKSDANHEVKTSDIVAYLQECGIEAGGDCACCNPCDACGIPQCGVRAGTTGAAGTGSGRKRLAFTLMLQNSQQKTVAFIKKCVIL